MEILTRLQDQEEERKDEGPAKIEQSLEERIAEVDMSEYKKNEQFVSVVELHVCMCLF